MITLAVCIYCITLRSVKVWRNRLWLWTQLSNQYIRMWSSHVVGGSCHVLISALYTFGWLYRTYPVYPLNLLLIDIFLYYVVMTVTKHVIVRLWSCKLIATTFALVFKRLALLGGWYFWAVRRWGVHKLFALLFHLVIAYMHIWFDIHLWWYFLLLLVLTDLLPAQLVRVRIWESVCGVCRGA